MVSLTGPQLIAAYKGKLASSGLTPKDGEKLALEPIPASDAKALGYKNHAAMRIPYFDMSGNIKPFERVRYLEDTRSTMERVLKKKERRYDQLKGTGVDAYLPPLMREKWGMVLRDPTVPLVITEGELKAACATKHGVPTAGLGGVWNFADPSDKVRMIDALEMTIWEDRQVYIAYDSDAATNTKVLQAENRLAAYVLERNAQPFIVRVPNVLGEGGKTGIDDFIIAQGIDDFKQLMEEAEEFEVSRVLRAFNEEAVYLKESRSFVDLVNNIRMNASEFKVHYAPRKYTGIDKDGDPVVKPMIPAWIEWAHRRELLRSTYRPEGDRVVDGELNMWQGWGVLPKPGSVKPWHELVDFLFSSDPIHGEEKKKWLTQWFAFPIQNPGAKLNSAPLLVGGSGVGKTMIFDIVKMLYGENSISITAKHFNANHNTWAENKQFVVGNEVVLAGEKFETAELLKEIITRTEVLVNPKFVNEYKIPDCINYGFTTNKPHALPLEDDDRRYFIHRVPASPHPQGEAFYDRVGAWAKDGGAAALFDYFLHVDLEGFNPFGRALATIDKEEMKAHGRTELADWVHTLKLYPDEVTRVGRTLKAYDLYTSEELFAMFSAQRLAGDSNSKFNAIGLGRELASQGILMAAQGRSCPTADGKQRRLWVIRNHAKYLKLGQAETGSAYDADRGLSAVPKRRKI